MTVFGWDASHYDGVLTTSILNRAKAEGINFFTHKVGEGLTDTEGTNDDTALLAARNAGMIGVGGYFVPRTLDSAAQIDRWWELLNASEPWWRDFPGWFNQIDLERWPYDNVSAAKGIDCAKRWRDRTQRQTILYASHGQYGDSLSAWDGPLWNADYVSKAASGFVIMYPGDTWLPKYSSFVGGWGTYSGKIPTILQYTSSAVVAGLTTCDVNAFRGSVNEFKQFLGSNEVELTTPVPSVATPDVPQRDLNQTLGDMWHGIHINMYSLFSQVTAKLDVLNATVSELQTVVDGLQGGSVMTDADRNLLQSATDAIGALTSHLR